MTTSPGRWEPVRYEPGELKDLAARYGLKRVGARPGIPEYLRSLWDRRHFLWVLATSRAYSRNQNNYLGQVWALLNPLLLAAVYYLVFGLLLQTTGGVENYTAFLIVGIFIFQHIASVMTAGSGAVLSNINLVRSLTFPRAVLPLATAVSEMVSLIPAIVAMLAIVLLTGEQITLAWLLLPAAMLLMLLFNAGCAMLAARLVVAARDLRNLIPVAVRMLRYVSGVFFSIDHYTGDALGVVMEYQPVAVFLTMFRSILLEEYTLVPSIWLAGAAWAVGVLVVGFLFFWQAEERYGRD